MHSLGPMIPSPDCLTTNLTSYHCTLAEEDTPLSRSRTRPEAHTNHKLTAITQMYMATATSYSGAHTGSPHSPTRHGPRTIGLYRSPASSKPEAIKSNDQSTHIAPPQLCRRRYKAAAATSNRRRQHAVINVVACA